MSKHTKGPWKENACEIQAQDGSPICEILARPEDSGANYPYSPEADANSRLICAAPELLAALEDCLILDDIAPTALFDSIHGRAREVIAKAKGCE